MIKEILYSNFILARAAGIPNINPVVVLAQAAIETDGQKVIIKDYNSFLE